MAAQPPNAAGAASTAPAASAPSTTTAASAGTRSRLESVDLLRGLVMVVMALDHVRNHLHLGAETYDPTDLTHATPAVFLTRWITHFCAPVFVFLAGTGAFLWGARGRTKNELSRYLLTRGLWLILLEVTVVNFEWNLRPTISFIIAQVIWALGWSMIALAALVRWPIPAIGAFGWWMIAMHNLFDGPSFGPLHYFVLAFQETPLAWILTVLHVPGPIFWAPGHSLLIVYPLIPWIGVMAAGYAFGSWLVTSDPERRRRMIALGIFFVAVFLELRTYNFYGDPHPWAHQKNALLSALSFINCQKYPPSLLFLMMTLGPALLLLGLLDRGVPRFARPLLVFGRVPLFYYVLHLALIDAITVGAAYARYGARTREMFGNGPPPDWGYSLPVVYAVWLAVVLALYPVCRWYAGVKARSSSRWLSYL